MFQIIKDNFLYFVAVILLMVGCVYLVSPEVPKTYHLITEVSSQKAELNNLRTQESDLRIREANKAKTPSKDGKKIYEIEGAQFSPEASFAPLFEMVLSIAQNSGIRIRSIEYNYHPESDPVYMAHIPEYNVCELSIVSVGTYTQIQNFYKGIMKDQNLAYVAEVEMTPWEKDKTLLISKSKIRLYTKTPGAPSLVPVPTAAPDNAAEKDGAAPAAPAPELP